MKYVLALDQGTTSSRAMVFDIAGVIRAAAQKEFEQIFPQLGWVEHDPDEIWSSQISTVAEALARAGIGLADIVAAGFWKDVDDLGHHWQVDRVFEPRMEAGRVAELRSSWNKAVQRAKGWAETTA